MNKLAYSGRTALLLATLTILAGCTQQCDCNAPGATGATGMALSGQSSKLDGTWAPDIDATLDPALFAMKNPRMELLKKGAASVRLTFADGAVTVRLDLPPGAVKKAKRPRLVQAAMKGMTLPYTLLEETAETARFEVQKPKQPGATILFSVKLINEKRLTIENLTAKQPIPPIFMNRLK
jgi:hypothetical protein